jgi:hypothetical protein
LFAGTVSDGEALKRNTLAPFWRPEHEKEN